MVADDTDFKLYELVGALTSARLPLADSDIDAGRVGLQSAVKQTHVVLPPMSGVGTTCPTDIDWTGRLSKGKRAKKGRHFR